MQQSLTSRELTDFGNYFVQLTQSYSQTPSGQTNSSSASAYTSFAGGLSSTVFNYTQEGRSTNDSASFYNHSVFGGTTYCDATQTSSSSSSSNSFSFTSAVNSTSTTASAETSSTGASYSTGVPLSYTYWTTTTASGSISYLNTTANVATTTSFWTVQSGSLLTSSTNVTAVSNVSSGGGVYTTLSLTSNSGILSSGTYSTYIDWGTVVSADASDWLWLATNSSFGTSLVTDFAVTLNASTFWNSAVTATHNYATIGDTNLTTGTIALPVNTYTLPFEQLVSVSSGVSTITSGDLLYRDTVTTTVSVWSAVSDSSSFGFSGGTTTAYSTSTVSALTTSAEACTVTSLYPVGYGNYSTTTLQSFSTFYTTASYYTQVDTYLASSSTSDSDGSFTSAYGVTMASTDLFFQQMSLISFGGNPGNGFFQQAPFGAFVSPSDLDGDGNAYNFGGNLSIGETQIPYPAFVSVFSNALTPSPFSTATSGTDGVSWSFKWSSDTLHYTQYSSGSGDASTATRATYSSGVFSTSSDVVENFSSYSNTFGGFPALPSAAETVTFPPRAVLGTSIDDAGSSTYRTLATDSSTLTVSGTVIVETPIPAYIVYSFLGWTAPLPILGFDRNMT